MKVGDEDREERLKAQKEAQKRFEEKMKEVRDYLEEQNVPRALANSVRLFLRQFHSRQGIFD